MQTGVSGSNGNEHASAIAAAPWPHPGRHADARKLQGKVALLNGHDLPMARSIAHSFALEGARIGLCNVLDLGAAREVRRSINANGGTCLIASDACDGRDGCRRVVEGVVAQLGALDILVNCGSVEMQPDSDQISRIESTFRSSTFAYLYLMAAALPYLPEGGSIINSSSLDADGGAANPARAAAESAIVALTRSFADTAASRGVRVNAVARRVPARATQSPRKSLGRDGQAKTIETWGEPASGVGAACVFLASVDSTRITGQIFHINLGGILDGKQ